MTPAVRPVVFRLYPERGTRYVRAVVWPTHAALIAHARSIGYRLTRHNPAHCFGVVTRKYGAGGRQWTYGVVAEAHFHRGALSPEVVSHEMQHAAFAWARRIRFRWAVLGAPEGYMPSEERLCYLHTHLCSAFVRRAHRAGLYGDDWWQATDLRRAA